MFAFTCSFHPIPANKFISIEILYINWIEIHYSKCTMILFGEKLP